MFDEHLNLIISLLHFIRQSFHLILKLIHFQRASFRRVSFNGDSSLTSILLRCSEKSLEIVETLVEFKPVIANDLYRWIASRHKIINLLVAPLNVLW